MSIDMLPAAARQYRAPEKVKLFGDHSTGAPQSGHFPVLQLPLLQ